MDVVRVLEYKMNYDRKKQEDLLYNEKVRQANMQSDNIDMEKMFSSNLQTDYRYQMELLKKQLQMLLDEKHFSTEDLDKKLKIVETQNKILQVEKQFLLDTLKEHGILTHEVK